MDEAPSCRSHTGFANCPEVREECVYRAPVKHRSPAPEPKKNNHFLVAWNN